MTDYTLSCPTWPGMAKLQEESGELNTVFGKIISNRGSLNYWDDRYLDDDLHDELADTQAALIFFIMNNDLDTDYIMDRVERKLALYKEWADNGE